MTATSADDLITRLEAMIPDLRARGRAAEEAGRIPQDTIDELRAAGAFRAVVPKRHGGLEVDYPYIPQIFRTLGRGCVSTGWSMGFLIYHNFQFAHFPEKAQEETWGAKGYTMAPGQVMPAGKARRVEGGYMLNGRWGYATGIHHGDWMLLSAPVEGASPSEIRRFYAPVGDFEVLDTWHVAAMKATGSDDVTLTECFVPEHRSVLVSDLREQRAEGLALNPGPLWRMPLLTFMSFGAVGPLVGAAEAMLELVTEALIGKIGAYSGDKQSGLQSQRIRLARLEMELEATIRLYEAAIDDAWDKVKSGAGMTREDRARARMVVAQTNAKCRQIVDELAHAGGSRGNYLESPMQRFHRDVSALSTHALFEYDHIATLHGGVRMGVPLPDNAMI